MIIKVGLMVWSPLAGGLLSGKYSREEEKKGDGRRANFDFPPVNRDRAFDIVDKLKPMAESKCASVAQLALTWLLQQPAVTTVIIGANKMEQLEDNLKAIDVKFTEEELKQIDEVSKLPNEYPGWMLQLTGGDAPEINVIPLKRKSPILTGWAFLFFTPYLSFEMYCSTSAT